MKTLIERFADALDANASVAEMLLSGEIPMGDYEKGILKQVKDKEMDIEAASIASDEH